MVKSNYIKVMTNQTKLLGIIIELVQFIDIVIHVAVDQVEPIRITSNIVLLVWVMGTLLNWFGERLRAVSLAAVGLYLLLNLIFLIQNGLTNPEQGDAPRTALFLLVMVSVVISGLLIRKVK